MWPNLVLPPINLWNVPHMLKKLTIIDKILDEELRYYIRMHKYATVVYLGKKEAFNLFKELPVSHSLKTISGLKIIRVAQENYLRVG